MTQIESNASLAIGLEVLYLSRRGHTYHARVTQIGEHERCNLRVYNLPGITMVYGVVYDSDGQERHSWHKKSDIPLASEVHKQRCPIDNNTLFYFTGQGISQRCRHCKGVHIIPWAEILLQYQELCGILPAPGD